MRRRKKIIREVVAIVTAIMILLNLTGLKQKMKLDRREAEDLKIHTQA